MGVPAFFKWLTLRYPKIVMDAIEEVNVGFDINNFLANSYNMDTAMPSIDNFYLDMNGIIHPCCHPQDRPQPSSEEEMFNSIFDYCDKLIRIIKPGKLMYLAIDGVAPRAKMNQQRSRRFRAAFEAREKKAKEKVLLDEWLKKGLKSPENSPGEAFDSNVITPGTQFMFNLSKALKFYINHRLNFDPLWKGLTVIFSDSSVPGEGEHKILEFIRLQRAQKGYNPNTKHCIYGADADLIMLSLITHEPHFFIIRESLNENAYKKCDFCGMNGHYRDDCKKLLNQCDETGNDSTNMINNIEFSLIKVHIVREYLQIEFRNLKLPFQYDFERIIDDFVFLCFFVGNDFLPHLPSLKIREGAIDALIYLYKKIIVSLDGYLTEGNGKINLSRTEKLLEKLAIVEDEIFKRELINKEERNENNMNYLQHQRESNALQDFLSIKPVKDPASESNKEEINLLDDFLNDVEQVIDKQEQNIIHNSEDTIQKLSVEASKNFQKVLKEILKQDNQKKIEEYKDPVRLGEKGWKNRYYSDKFKISQSDVEFKMLIKRSYIEGICWVFAYYYSGCASWEWFYPYHYAPFASDLCDIRNMKISFHLGEPFQPFEQLLSVLPPYSSRALPNCLRELMNDPESEIADFYPSNIRLDINGQAFAWMGVNLIPFVEENRIRKVVAKKAEKKEFSEEDLARNKNGDTLILFYSSANERHLSQISKVITNVNEKYNKNIYLDHLTGNVQASAEHMFVFGKSYSSPFPGIKLETIRGNKVNTLIFMNPNYKMHSSGLLNGVILPKKNIIEDNLDMYPKTKFKGKQAIEVVKRILGYEDDDIEQSFRHEVFDRCYNNNRAIEYNPSTLEYLRKKRYKEQQKDDDNTRNERKIDIQVQGNFSQRRDNRTPQYVGVKSNPSENVPVNPFNNPNARAYQSLLHTLIPPKNTNESSENKNRAANTINSTIDEMLKTHQLYNGNQKK